AEPAELEQALPLLDRAIALQRRVLATSPAFERSRMFLTFHLRLSGNTLARLGRRTALEQVAAELAHDTGNAQHHRAVARFWLRAMAMPDDSGGTAESRDHRALALAALLLAERAGWQSNIRLDEPVYAPLAEL